MKSRDYYSQRTGPDNNRKWNLKAIKDIFLSSFEEFSSNKYFGKSFGYYRRSGWAKGIICANSEDECIQRYFLRKLKKDRPLWPIDACISSYTEEDLFDVIEISYDLIAKPYAHNPCLVDDSSKPAITSDFSDADVIIEFNEMEGKTEFRTEINKFLIDYDEGFELSEDGEVRLVGDKDLSGLFKEEKPSSGNEDIDQRIEKAITKFRHHRSSDDEKKAAIIELDLVREFLKKDLITLRLTNDEKYLTEIVNTFAIRHLKDPQRIEYDKKIFFTWIFSSYLSLIFLVLRLKERQKPGNQPY
jgi:hypothetical protein